MDTRINGTGSTGPRRVGHLRTIGIPNLDPFVIRPSSLSQKVANVWLGEPIYRCFYALRVLKPDEIILSRIHTICGLGGMCHGYSDFYISSRDPHPDSGVQHPHWIHSHIYIYNIYMYILRKYIYIYIYTEIVYCYSIPAICNCGWYSGASVVHVLYDAAYTRDIKPNGNCSVPHFSQPGRVSPPPARTSSV